MIKTMVGELSRPGDEGRGLSLLAVGPEPLFAFHSFFNKLALAIAAASEVCN